MGDEKLRAEWFWTDRWFGSSAYFLPLEARGLYRELLTRAWSLGGVLPADPAVLVRMVAATQEEWDRSWPLVEKYFVQQAGGLVNLVQLEILDDSKRRRMALTGLSSMGGKARAESAKRDDKGRFSPSGLVQQAGPASRSSRTSPPDQSLSLDLTPDPNTPSQPPRGGGDPSGNGKEEEPWGRGFDGDRVLAPGLVYLWNEVARQHGCPRVTAFPPRRQRAAKNRAKEEGDPRVWASAFHAICSDDFLTGKNDRDQVFATFDYALSRKGDRWLDEARSRLEGEIP